MKGGCYCGAVRYALSANAVMKGQCHCRECQYISGGGPNFYMVVPNAGYQLTKGAVAEFRRPDLENPVTREFCGTCGTHILTRRDGLDMVILKVGTLDNPADFVDSDLAIYMKDAQPFHVVAEGKPSFDEMPARR